MCIGDVVVSYSEPYCVLVAAYAALDAGSFYSSVVDLPLFCSWRNQCSRAAPAGLGALAVCGSFV